MVVTNQSHWFFLPPKTKQQNIDLFYNKYNNITNKLQTQSKKGKHKKKKRNWRQSHGPKKRHMTGLFSTPTYTMTKTVSN